MWRRELTADDAFRARFLRESQLAAEIEHPHVVPVLRVGEEDGQLFIAMRYVRGSDLAALIAAERCLDPLRAARIVDQVGYALDAAHERGLVHRDVKPANVLIERDRRGEHAYLADFGLTKLAEGSKITVTGLMVGTVDYMPPEQIEGWPVDARADVYALGCVLCQMLTGRVPYPRESLEARLFAHLTAPAPDVSMLEPGVPRPFDDVVRRALAKQPDERYPSAGDLGRAALAAAEGRSLTGAEHSVATGNAAPTGTLSAASPSVTRPALTGAEQSAGSAPIATEPARAQSVAASPERFEQPAALTRRGHEVAQPDPTAVAAATYVPVGRPAVPAGVRLAAAASAAGAILVIASLRISPFGWQHMSQPYRVAATLLAAAVILLLGLAVGLDRRALLAIAAGLALALLGQMFPLSWTYLGRHRLPRNAGFWLGAAGAALAAAAAAAAAWLAFAHAAKPSGEIPRPARLAAVLGMACQIIVIGSLFVLPEVSKKHGTTWYHWRNAAERYPLTVVVLSALTIGFTAAAIRLSRRRALDVAAILACLVLGEAAPLIYPTLTNWGPGRWLGIGAAVTGVLCLTWAAVSARSEVSSAGGHPAALRERSAAG